MNSPNQSILSCFLASVNESALSKKSIDWVLREVEAYFNGHYHPGHRHKDTQKNERRTILLGYVLLTIFEIKSCQESEMVNSNEKHLFNLGEKSLIQESAKIACQFEKSIQLKQEEGEASKLLCDSLFAKATEGLSGRKEGQRRLILTGIEALESKGAVNMWLNSILKDCSERDDTTTKAGENVGNMDEVESVESPLVVTIDLKERDLMTMSLSRIQEDLANEMGSHDTSSEVKKQEYFNNSLSGAGVGQ